MTPEELKKLREKAAKLLADARAINDRAKSEKRGLNAEDSAQYDAIMADFADVKGQIERAEKFIAAEQYMGEVLKDGVRDVQGKAPSKNEKDEEYSREFYAMIRGGEFNRNILRNLEAGTDAKGGYTVPTVLLNSVIAALNETNFLRQLGTVLPTASTTNIPTQASKPTFSLVAENGAYPTVDTTFGVKTIKAYKVGGTMLASDELLNDSGIDVAAYIQKLMTDGIGDFEEDKFISGTGTNDFTGLSAATTGLETASATAVTSDEILNMQYSVKSKYRPKASWILSDKFELAVMKLKDTTGRYIWQMGLTQGAPNMLNGRPVYNSSYLGDLVASSVPAIFGDISYFTIADRGIMTVKRLNELYAGTGQVGFQVTKRGDSKITLDEAIKKLVMKAS